MRLPRGVRVLFRLDDVRPGGRSDVEDELRYHLERAAQDLVDQGMEQEEARAEAVRRFGDLEAYRRALRHIDGTRRRKMRRLDAMDTVRSLLGQVVRSLVRSPGFAFAVVTVLALGMGANTVMFGVVDRLLLSPPRYVQDADRVTALYLVRTLAGRGTVTGRTVSYPDYDDMKRVPGFQAVAAVGGDGTETLGRGEGARTVRVRSVSASLFPLLGVEPSLGRFFTADEDVPGAPATVVLSHEFWERAFAADPEAVGTTLDLDSGEYTVVGVAPPGFTGADLTPVDLWYPLEVHQERTTGGTDWKDHRNWWWVHIVARLAPGVTPEMAGEQATAAHRQGREEDIAGGRYDAGATLQAASLIAARGPRPSDESRVARWLAAVSAIVLLIACFNVANLLLARSARRRREVAVRVALGVSRVRLLAQLFLESLVLASLGGVAAMALAQVGGRALYGVLLPDVAFGSGVETGRTAAFLGLVTLATAFLTGLAPAFRVLRDDPASFLKSGGVGGGWAPSRARPALMVGQAALSVVLLVAAGLFVRSLHRAQSLDLGFDARHIAVGRLQWNESLPGDERAGVYAQALERVRRLPGVRAAGVTYTVPFQSSVSLGRLRVPGFDSIPRHPAGGPYANKVSSGYFEAMELTLVMGRGFQREDDAPGAAPRAVVSRGMARALWPEGDAVGSCMYLDPDDGEGPCTEVVGVVEDHRREDLVEDDPHWLYFLNEGHPAFGGPPQALMVGTEVDASGLLPTIQAELRAVSPLVRFASVKTLQSNVDPQLRSWTLGAAMFSAFGLLALVVAAWGLYSVLAFDVSLRRRELGIRAALGADVGRLVRMVLARALGLGGLGVALGLGVAAFASRWVGALLFRVSPWDVAVYASVASALLIVTVLAGLLPALRATRVEPCEALNAE